MSCVDGVSPKQMTVMIQHAENYTKMLEWLFENHRPLIKEWKRYSEVVEE